ncbi:hypothetical protein HDU67_003383 [Dinochytrium kinnereticum]|nr:hypothetical protein HDU67_003383 [Dinochytrium kinnereticum]
MPEDPQQLRRPQQPQMPEDPHQLRRRPPPPPDPLSKSDQQNPTSPTLVAPPRRPDATRENSETDLVAHIRKLENSLKDRQQQIVQLQNLIETISKKGPTAAAAPNTAPRPASGINPLAGLSALLPKGVSSATGDPVIVDRLRELVALQKCLSVYEPGKSQNETTDLPHLSDEMYLDILISLDEKIRKRLEADDLQLAEIQRRISGREREWQDQSSVSVDDPNELRAVAWCDWPIHNKLDKSNYKFDFFISYRVASEYHLAREMRLQFAIRGKKAFLDQEELKDGEDWRKGFVTGLKRSKVIIFLISRGCIERMMRSGEDVDNVLLEWETAMCAEQMGFCHVVPVYIGRGELDFKNYPKDRATLISRDRESDLVCQQSAYTTLRQVSRLPGPLYLPESREGSESIIDDLIYSLDEFDDCHEEAANRRALLTFCQMASLETFKSEDKDIIKTWMNERLQLLHIPKEDFQKVEFMLGRNKNWKEFAIEELGPIEEFLAVLKMVMAKNPKKIIVKERIINSGEPMTYLSILSKYPSLESIGFSETVFDNYNVISEIFKLVEHLPNVKEICFSCKTKTTQIPIFSDQNVADLIGLLKKRKNIISVQLSGLGPQSYVFQAFIEGLGSTCVQKLDFSDNLHSMSDIVPLLQDYIKQSPNLQYLDLSDVVLTAKGLLHLFNALLNTRVEILEISSFVGSGEPNFHYDTAKALENFLMSTSYLKTLMLKACFSEKPSTVGMIVKALSINKTITSLNLANNLFSNEQFEVLIQYLKRMPRLEYFDFTGNNVTGSGLEATFDSLFAMKTLRSVSFDNNLITNEGAKAIAECLLTGTTVAEISIEQNPIKDDGIMALAVAAQGIETLRELSLRGPLCGEEAVQALLEAFRGQSDLMIQFDCTEELTELVRNEYILPRLFELNGEAHLENKYADSGNDSTVIRFNEASELSRQKTKHSAEATSRLISDTKSDILKMASKLSEKENELFEMMKIFNAVEIVSRNFKRSTITHNYLNFQPEWPFELNDPSPSVALLQSILPDSTDTISDADFAIIREISLRLLTARLPQSLEVWLKEDDDDDNNYSRWDEDEELNSDEEEDESANITGYLDDDAQSLEEFDITTKGKGKLQVAVRKTHYPKVHFSKTQKNAHNMTYTLYPDIVVLVLSDSILSDLDRSPEKFWAAINSWDYLMRSAEDGLFTVLPVFLATTCEPGAIIFNMMKKLRHSLYFLSAKHKESMTSSERSISRAFYTINRLFKLQGLTVANVTQVPGVVNKMLEVARNQLRKEDKVMNNLKILENEQYRKVFGVGVITGVFDLGCDITDSNYTVLAPMFSYPIFKKFVGTLGTDTETTSMEKYVMDALKKTSILESIYLDGYKSGESKDATDIALATLAKFMKKSRLTSIILKCKKNVQPCPVPILNMVTGKAAPLFADAISRHPTLTALHLHGFSQHFTKACAEKLVDNNYLRELTLSGRRQTEAGIFIESTLEDDDVRALCALLSGNKALRSVSLEYNSFTAAQVHALSLSLGKSTTIISFSFKGCLMGRVEIESLVSGLEPNKTLTELNIAENLLGPGGATCIASLLYKTSSLKTLDIGVLENVDPLGDGLIAILNNLTQNQTLDFLNLRGHPITGKTIEALLVALAVNVSLERLSLEACRMSGDNFAKIIGIISRAKRFKFLNLSANRMDDRASGELANCIGKEGSLLETLFIEDIQFSPQSLAAIFRAVEANKSITALHMNPSIDIPLSVINHMKKNQFLRSKESTKEAWEWALTNKDFDVRSHLLGLEDSEHFIAKETKFLFDRACDHGDLDLLESRFRTVYSNIYNSEDIYDNHTPIGKAIRGNHTEIVKFLFEREVSPIAVIQNDKSVPVFYYAAGTCGNPILAEMMLSYDPTFDPNMGVNDPVGESYVRRGFTALHKAALFGYHIAVEYLLPMVKNVNAVDVFGSTALHSVARGELRQGFGYDLRRRADSVDHLKVIMLLKKAGIDVNLRDNKGRTALGVAIFKKQDLLADALRSIGLRDAGALQEKADDLAKDPMSRIGMGIKSASLDTLGRPNDDYAAYGLSSPVSPDSPSPIDAPPLPGSTTKSTGRPPVVMSGVRPVVAVPGPTAVVMNAAPPPSVVVVNRSTVPILSKVDRPTPPMNPNGGGVMVGVSIGSHEYNNELETLSGNSDQGSLDYHYDPKDFEDPVINDEAAAEVGVYAGEGYNERFPAEGFEEGYIGDSQHVNVRIQDRYHNYDAAKDQTTLGYNGAADQGYNQGYPGLVNQSADNQYDAHSPRNQESYGYTQSEQGYSQSYDNVAAPRYDAGYAPEPQYQFYDPNVQHAGSDGEYVGKATSPKENLTDITSHVDNINRVLRIIRGQEDWDAKKERLRDLIQEANSESIWEDTERAIAVQKELARVESSVNTLDRFEARAEEAVSVLGRGIDYGPFCPVVSIVDELRVEHDVHKSATLQISGRYAYGWCKYEVGVHRFVRLSKFSTDGKRQTSFVSVKVFPFSSDSGDAGITDINLGDLKIEVMRAQGAGGQHVNKTESAVRITHLPTGITVACQNSRSQHQNKATAMQMLKARLYQREMVAQAQAKADSHAELPENAWGNQIRSYVMQPYQMVKDLRTGHERSDIANVLDGDVSDFMEAAVVHFKRKG